MARYVIARPKGYEAEWDEWPVANPVTNLTVEDSEAVDTGLLDASGNAIWRTKDPIGFMHFDA